MKVKDSSYWNGQGKYEEKYTTLQEHLEQLVGGNYNFNWRNPKIAHFALLNGVAGLYYEKYNNGGNARSAVDNNKVHGYQNVSDFRELAKSLGANEVTKYLDYGSKANLEKAMDEAILIAWNKYEKTLKKRETQKNAVAEEEKNE